MLPNGLLANAPAPSQALDELTKWSSDWGDLKYAVQNSRARVNGLSRAHVTRLSALTAAAAWPLASVYTPSMLYDQQ